MKECDMDMRSPLYTEHVGILLTFPEYVHSLWLNQVEDEDEGQREQSLESYILKGHLRVKETLLYLVL